MSHGVIFCELQIRFFLGRKSFFQSTADGLERPEDSNEYNCDYLKHILFAHADGFLVTEFVLATVWVNDKLETGGWNLP